MKLKRYYIIISFIIMFTLMCFLYNDFHKKSYAGYILERDKTIDRTNYDNFIYYHILNILKTELKDEEDVIAVFVDNDFGKYSSSLNLERAFSGSFMYPRVVTEVLYSTQLNDNMLSYLKEFNTNTIIYIGRNMNDSKKPLEYDVNVFDIKNDNSLVYRTGFNSDIYSLMQKYNEYGLNNKIEELKNITIESAKQYDTLGARMQLKKLAETYYDLKDYKNALFYYETYFKYDVSKEISDRLWELREIAGGDNK